MTKTLQTNEHAAVLHLLDRLDTLLAEKGDDTLRAYLYPTRAILTGQPLTEARDEVMQQICDAVADLYEGADQSLVSALLHEVLWIYDELNEEIKLGVPNAE